MNMKDITIQSSESGFRTLYCCHDIKWTNVHYHLGTIEFCYKEKQTIVLDVSKFVELSVYNSQFGIILTDDGTRFFVQSWEAGLFCFETETGNLLWHNKQKRAYNLATKGNVALCRYHGKCISIIDVETGLVIRSYPLGMGATFKPLSQDYYLVGPKRGYYQILDSNLDKQARVSVEVLNPNAMDTFIIQQASLAESGMIVEGVEYAADSFHAAIRAKTSSEFIEKSRFVRHIPVRFL